MLVRVRDYKIYMPDPTAGMWRDEIIVVRRRRSLKSRSIDEGRTVLSAEERQVTSDSRKSALSFSSCAVAGRSRYTRARARARYYLTRPRHEPIIDKITVEVLAWDRPAMEVTGRRCRGKGDDGEHRRRCRRRVHASPILYYVIARRATCPACVDPE